MAKCFPHQMSKKIHIFVIGCEKHSRRNAFGRKKIPAVLLKYPTITLTVFFFLRLLWEKLWENYSVDCIVASALKS